MFALLLCLIRDTLDLIQKSDFIQKTTNAVFVTSFNFFFINAYSANYLIKLFISFSISTEIMKCKLIVQNNECYLYLKRWNQKDRQLLICIACLFFVSNI